MYKLKRFLERYKLYITLVVILIASILLVHDFVYSRYISSLFVDELTGKFDKSLMWNAIGSISTSLAVILALFQYSFQNRKRVQLSFDRWTLVQNGVVGQTFVVLSISNIGLKTVNVQSWRFIIKGNKHLMLIPVDPYGNITQFPVNVSSEESMSLYFPIEEFSKFMAINFNEKKKLTMYIIDTVGSRYYLTTDFKISYYLSE